MKKIFRILLKIVKWGLILIFSFYFFGILIFGFNKQNRNGMIDFRWSGIGALFTDEDFEFVTNKRMTANFDGVDGPYIVKNKIYTVSENNELKIEQLGKEDSINVIVQNSVKDNFKLKLNETLETSNSVYQLPKKIVAISDIEGNYNAFSSFLMANKIIDEKHNWIFGNGHLVLNGDFVDRGDNVTQVLWLIYKLDNQAKANGGQVYFILGNHEIINFQGRWNYNKRKYIRVAQEVSTSKDWDTAIKFMYSDKTELGKWLRTKNVIEKIGNYIFVHAGLSPEILNYDISLEDINQISRKNWDDDLYNNPKENKIANFLIGRKSPIWYRGLAIDYKYYDKITDNELNQILSFYDADKIVIGHTVVDDITTDFDGKVIKIDLKHGKEKNSGLTKGLLIENRIEYKIDDKGNKETLK